MKLKSRIRKDTSMKCIQKDDKIKRVPDSEAQKLVAEKGWKFVKKSVWKEHGRTSK